MGNAPDAGEWFVVHPAFDDPRPADGYWLGVVESDIQEWVDALGEEEQEAQLRASWRQVAKWAVERRADRIIVDVEIEFIAELVRGGFMVDRYRHRVEFVGRLAEMSLALDRVAEVPRLNLVVYRGDVELVQVRDMSWDSVFARFGVDP